MFRAIDRLLVATFALTLVGCDAPRPEGLERGVSRELARIRAATLSEVAYDMRLRVPADPARPVTGEARIGFVWNDPEGRALVVDFKDAASRVSEVQIGGVEVAWDAVEDHMVLSPAALTPGTRNEVRIAFTAGDEALNRQEEFLYTLFVPDRAHFSLPVFDQPDLRATISWQLTVPPGWEAVANGPVEEEVPASAGEPRTLRFAASRPIPTYLMAFAAGRFRIEIGDRDGRRYRMLHRETDAGKVADNRDEIFDLVASSVAWMEDYTAIDYPFAKYDFVLLPAFQYGGMEHPGAVFYRASALLLDASAPQSARLGRASLIAHETAHMWFGDLVTMAWFDDVWTKEVFANFMAAKIVRPAFPEVDHDLRFLLAHHPAAYAVDRTPGANAIRQPLDNLREAGTLYGPIIYQKAPIAMRQLEVRAGAELMQWGLRRYLERFAWGNATWPELIAILDERTPDDLQRWSRAWIEEPGRPTVELRIEEFAGGFRPVVRQSDPWGRDRLWPQRLLLLELRGLRGRVTASVQVEEAETTFPRWGAGRPRWILPNGAGIEYGRFVLEDADLEFLVEDLTGIDNGVVRASAWLVVLDALLEGQLPPDRVVDRILEALESEGDEQMVDFLVGWLGTIYWDFLDPETRLERAPAVEAALEEGLARAEGARAKATWFDGWRRMALTPGAVDRMRRLWSGETAIEGLPLTERDRTALAEALALRGVDDAETILDRQAERIDNPDRRARFDFVRPAYSPDPARREAFFERLVEPGGREREPWALDGLRALSHPLRQDHARRFLEPGLALLPEIQRTGDIFFPARWLGALLGGHQTPEAAWAVAAYLESANDLPRRLREKVLQAADGVVRSARIVHGDAPVLEPIPRVGP